jgi:hypothetical protein
MAMNKSKSFLALLDHTSVYALWGWLLPIPMFDRSIFVVYLIFTHTIIDGITSKINAYLWNKNDRHNFFTMIGFDQLLHYVTIFWFLKYIGV